MTDSSQASSTGAWVERDIPVGSIRVPDWLEDKTWYEFHHETHALKTITVDRTELGPEYRGAWVRQRRERYAALGAPPGEVQVFSNPEFACEGFSLQLDGNDPNQTAFFVAVGAAETLTLMVFTTFDKQGFVHALVERLQPDRGVPPPQEAGWSNRRAHGIWLPVPAGTTGPQQSLFVGNGVSVSVRDPGTDADFPAAPDSGESLTSDSGHASALWFAAPLAPEANLLAFARVQGDTNAALLRAEATPEAADSLRDIWHAVVRSVVVSTQ